MSDATELKECVDDIKAECASFGAMISCVVPTKGDLQGFSDADVGKCFVKYELVSSAVKAHDALGGRQFDGNTVKASFLPTD